MADPSSRESDYEAGSRLALDLLTALGIDAERVVGVTLQMEAGQAPVVVVKRLLCSEDAIPVISRISELYQLAGRPCIDPAGPGGAYINQAGQQPVQQEARDAA
jgi:hypothetical protein